MRARGAGIYPAACGRQLTTDHATGGAIGAVCGRMLRSRITWPLSANRHFRVYHARVVAAPAHPSDRGLHRGRLARRLGVRA